MHRTNVEDESELWEKVHRAVVQAKMNGYPVDILSNEKLMEDLKSYDSDFEKVTSSDLLSAVKVWREFYG